MQTLGGLDEDTDLVHLAQELPEPSDLLESEDDAPIIRLINALLTQAVKDNASDIHIEPFENRLVVRFRVDGVLREVLQPKRAVAPLIVSRIKVMSRARHRREAPAAGRPHLPAHRRPRGRRARLDDAVRSRRARGAAPARQAGRPPRPGAARHGRRSRRRLVDELIHKPHGILLVTGPTGSGKTTTLYAALDRINDRTRNIMTVEDPIEYYIDGIGQTQVNTRVEMTFARGLRAILRQDPDVVMVGEIRDLETAEIAVQASLTGHLVLSHPAHQHRRRRGHPPARHGHRAVPARLEPDRRAGAAPGARARSVDPRGLHRRRIRTPASEPAGRRPLAHALPSGAATIPPATRAAPASTSWCWSTSTCAP